MNSNFSYIILVAPFSPLKMYHFYLFAPSPDILELFLLDSPNLLFVVLPFVPAPMLIPPILHFVLLITSTVLPDRKTPPLRFHCDDYDDNDDADEDNGDNDDDDNDDDYDDDWS